MLERIESPAVLLGLDSVGAEYLVEKIRLILYKVLTISLGIRKRGKTGKHGKVEVMRKGGF